MVSLNKEPPDVTFKKKEKGGVTVTNTVPLKNIDEETIKSICHEYRIANAAFSIRCDVTADDIIDVIEGKRVYVPCIYVLNKIDQTTIADLDVLSKCPHYVPVSAQHGWNLDGLVEQIWSYLDLTRIYTKPRGQIPDYNAPVILRTDRRSVKDFCTRIHKHLVSQMKYALVWGLSVKHNPQKVGKDHVLQDEDIVQIVKR